ncbi:hypothetical protein V1498_13315 [Peribacillus sp. SCS-26]|uniref:hypothetical protein n=1 Tax=Paraperibacillus marinus TaxID=3115295 RepID=UPI0039063720
MDKEKLYQRMESMIMSSSKKPKYMSISTVKIADILEMTVRDIDQGIKELVEEGRLKQSRLEKPPHNTIYLLP